MKSSQGKETRLGEEHVRVHYGEASIQRNPFEISAFVTLCGAVAQAALFSHGIHCPQPDTLLAL
jgi:hypothetical protein